MSYSGVESQIKFLQGKVLTVVDASMPDTDQRKAVKDLVKNAFSEQLNWIYEICTDFNSRILTKNGEMPPVNAVEPIEPETLT